MRRWLPSASGDYADLDLSPRTQVAGVLPCLSPSGAWAGLHLVLRWSAEAPWRGRWQSTRSLAGWTWPLGALLSSAVHGHRRARRRLGASSAPSLGPSKSCCSPSDSVHPGPEPESRCCRQTLPPVCRLRRRRLTLQPGVRSPERSPRAPAQPGLGHVFLGLREGPAPLWLLQLPSSLAQDLSVQKASSHITFPDPDPPVSLLQGLGDDVVPQIPWDTSHCQTLHLITPKNASCHEGGIFAGSGQ